MTDNDKNSPFSQLDSMFESMDNMAKSLDERVKNMPSNNLVKKFQQIEFDASNDKFADFTEIENEHGEIVLVKYGEHAFEFRNNNYSLYILANEKTGEITKGIAKYDNGRYEHILDADRLYRIKAKIKQDILEFYHSIGSIYPTMTNDTINVVFCNFQNTGLNKGLKRDIWDFECNTELFGKVKKLEKNEIDEILSLYKVYTQTTEESIIENEFKHLDNDYLRIFCIIPVAFALFYPISELLLWIGEKFLSLDIIALVKSLPYAYHPDIKWFCYFSINVVCFAMFGHILRLWLKNQERNIAIFGSILAVAFLFIINNSSIFNIVANISSVLFVLGVVSVIGNLKK